jgi:hypothetical protein
MANPIVEHLSHRKNRIQRLLTPWLRNAVAHAGGSPAIPVGLRFREAARTMRVLGESRIRDFKPQHTVALGSKITQKFEHVRELTHIAPKMTRSPGVWSDVERVLPRAKAAEPEKPVEPGVLTRGSIIPRFRPPSKPETSSTDRPSAAPAQKPTARTVERPRLNPKDRLFARVEEMSPKKQGDGEPSDSAPEPPVKSSAPPAVQREPEPSARTALPAQRPAEPPAEHRPLSDQVQARIEPHRPETPAPPQASVTARAAAHEPQPIKPAQTPAVSSLPTVVPQKTRSQTPLARLAVPKQPGQKLPLPVAKLPRPVSQVEKPKAVPTARKATLSRQDRTFAASTPAVIQRQADHAPQASPARTTGIPPAIQASPRPQGAVPDRHPETVEPADQAQGFDSNSMPGAVPPSLPSQGLPAEASAPQIPAPLSASQPAEMPLRNTILKRVHAAQTQVQKTRQAVRIDQPSIVARRQDHPLVIPHKYQVQSPSSGLGETPRTPSIFDLGQPKASQPQGLLERTLSQMGIAQPPASPNATEQAGSYSALPAPLVRPAAEPKPKPAPSQVRTGASDVGPTDDQTPDFSIQRFPDEDGTVQRSLDDQVKGAANDMKQKVTKSKGVEIGSHRGKGSTDNLEQIAEDILPIIKHLLSIEAERSGLRS